MGLSQLEKFNSKLTIGKQQKSIRKVTPSNFQIILDHMYIVFKDRQIYRIYLEFAYLSF